MTEVATEGLNITTEAELFDQFARYGVTEATYEFYVGSFYPRGSGGQYECYEVHRVKTKLHGENIPDEVVDELRDIFNEFAERRANEIEQRTAEDEYATLTYDVAAREIDLEVPIEKIEVDYVNETYKPDEG